LLLRLFQKRNLLALAVFAAGELRLPALKSPVKGTRVSAVDAAASASAVKKKTGRY